MRILQSTTYPFVITLIWAILCAGEILSSIYLCDHLLIYTLDDPYITLKVAQTILRGGYGVNFSEYASPSSSALFPLILAITERLGLGSAGPLILNLIAAGGAVYLGALFLERHVLGGLVTRKSAWFAYPLGILLIFAVSGVALPMTGLEHSWHVLLVVIVLFGLVELLATQGDTPVSLVAAIVLVPLFRFEGVALSLAAILALGYLGRWKAALTAAVLIIGSLVSYGAIMSHMGLPMLPSSVLLKSGAADAVVGSRGIFSIAISTMKNLYHTLWNSQGICLLFMILLMFRAWATATPGPHRRNITIIASVASFTLLAHMLGGSYDWFSRYEVYVIALGLLATLYTASKPVQEFVARRDWNAQIIVLASVAILVSHYFITALLTPFASRGVYEQQFQMHRFAADFYNKPVAVNDLGWVSYNNDNFVLDLYGLGSEPVRLMKMKHEFSPAKMAELAAHYGVGVVMIYEGWFNNLPPSWRRIAILHTQAVSAASDDVSFFVTPTADLGLVKQALANFQASLPPRVTLEISQF
jgi:hypothetical protein